jgi:alkylation response protein AidB-like acyl-CoA dehydrogenase
MTDQNKGVLEGIRELTPHITARATEIEAARRIPLDIVQSLKSAGVFRMFVPPSHGGLELALPTGLETIRALAE